MDSESSINGNCNARLVGVLIAPRRAACFSSLNSVLLKYENRQYEKDEWKTPGRAGRPATGVTLAHVPPFDEFMASLDAWSAR